ncbi:MAG: hypothetical protein WCE88_12600 [Burkholderiales bacterium]
MISFASEDKGNLITFAAEGELDEATKVEMNLKARCVKADTGLDLLPSLARLLIINPLNCDMS